MRAQSLHSFLTPVNLWTVTHQAPLSIGFSRQEYWSGFPSPPVGNLLGPGTDAMPPEAPAFQADYLPLGHRGSQSIGIKIGKYINRT